jgi:DNA replication protein DnaC
MTPALCQGLGVVRYEVPISDPRFGKLFRCPNNPVEADTGRLERLRRLSNLDLFADKNFENFYIHGETLEGDQANSLQHAVITSRNFADKPEGWLLLEGTYGTGKTHLAAAIGNLRLAQGDEVLFITVPDLLDHLRSAYAPSSEVAYDETFDRVRGVPLLILDDLGTENASGWAREKLFQLFNHRYVHRLPPIVTTNVELDLLDPRIRSRLLDAGIIRHVRILAPDYRTTIPNQYNQLSNLYLYNDMTFATFDTRSRLSPEEAANLERALSVAQSYAQNPEGWLVLSGRYASGKTHLAAAIANHQQQHQGSTVIFVTAPDLLDYLRVTFNPGTPVSFDQRFQMVRNTPFLVLDDLGTEHASPWAREKLFQILDYRYVTRLPTVITTSKEFDSLDARIRTRLMDKRRCFIFAILAPDYPTRMNRR